MTQTQRMDASLIQVLEIVTLPTEELKEKIKREAENNPVINLGEEEKSYDCPCHGSRFDQEGKVIDNPAQKHCKNI